MPRSLSTYLSEECPHWDYESEGGCDCALNYTKSGEKERFQWHQLQRIADAANAIDKGTAPSVQGTAQTILAILSLTFNVDPTEES